MNKMQTIGTPLKEWDVKINFGIKTGLNKALIIDDAIKERLAKEAPQSAAIIKPVLRGRDIRRYQANRAKFWLIYARKGIKINIYPAVYNYLQKHKKGLSKKSGTNQWYELLANISAESELAFKKEKLFWMDMSPHGRFAYSDSEMYSNDKAFVITGSFLKDLCAILNSAIVT